MGDSLDLENIINNSFLGNNISNDFGKIQDSFLESKFGIIIDKAVNLGLKSLLPDFIENQIIDIKDEIIHNGLKAGLNAAITGSIDLGKSLIGVFTGKFENISQIQSAVKKGGVIDSINSVMDKAIDMAIEANVIDKTAGKAINAGKKELFKNISNEIENNLEGQIKSIEKLEHTCNNWNEAFEGRNIDDMEKYYKKINKLIDNIIPLENVINKAREIENLHNLIKGNNWEFNISNESLELAKLL